MVKGKKSFAYGYAQVVNWFLSWAIFALVSVQGANIYRQGICDLYGLDMSVVLYMVSIAGWIGIAMYLVAPFLIRKIGARNLLVITASLGGVSFMLTGLIHNVYAVGFFSGLNDVLGGLYCASTTMVLVSKWFPRKKASIMGIVTSAGLVSSLVMLPVFNAIISAAGIKMAMIVAGLFILAYGLLSLVWLKETPEEAGLLPDNLPVDEAHDAELIGEQDEEWGWKEVLSKPKFWLTSVGWGLVLLILMGSVATTVSFMIMRGVDAQVAVLVMSASGVAQFVASIASGFVDQKIGCKKTSIIFLIMPFIGTVIAGFYGGASVALLALSCILIVGFFGAANNLFASQMLTIMGPKNYNISYNGLCTVTSIIKAFGTMIAAYSLSHTGGYEFSYKIFFIVLIVGGLFVILAGDKKIVPKKL